jgi:rhodanese-related sulfurtransferase
MIAAIPMEGEPMTELITRDELAAALRSDSVVLLDTLPADYYDRAHIRGAVNLVEADVEATAPQALPDRDASIVTYCANIACRNSEVVADRLRRLGYTNVRKYREGIEDWESAGLPIERSAPAAGDRVPSES